MLNNIIDKNIMFLENHGVKMDSDDRAVYRYGLQILYYYVIDLVVISSLAHFAGRLYETIIMMAVFGWLQVFGGGYHAKTPLNCLLTMITGLIIGNLFIILIADRIMINMMAVFIISGFIIVLAPVNNKNHPVEKKVFEKSKLVVKIAICVILFTTTLLNIFGKNLEVAVVTAVLVLYFISLICAKKQQSR